MPPLECHFGSASNRGGNCVFSCWTKRGERKEREVFHSPTYRSYHHHNQQLTCTELFIEGELRDHQFRSLFRVISNITEPRVRDLTTLTDHDANYPTFVWKSSSIHSLVTIQRRMLKMVLDASATISSISKKEDLCQIF